jgi:hypothetical protein
MTEMVPSPLGEAGDTTELELDQGVHGVQSDGLYVELYSGVAKDIPLLELRFGKRCHDNSVSPVLVADLATVAPWREGRLASPEKGEIGGGIGFGRNEVRGYRTMLGTPGEYGNLSLFMLGHSYYLRFVMKEGSGTKD